jgi:diguanylate cyclase (GGDEF)-like protein
VRESTVIPGPEGVRDLPWEPPDEFKQRLRIRRFLIASLFSVLYLLVIAIFSTQNKVDRRTLIEACAIVATFMLAFYVIFRTGFNLHFSDPSLTAWQLVAAVATMLYVVYHSPETRLAFIAFFFVALMFGMLRMRSRPLAIVGAMTIVSFLSVIGVRYAYNHDGEMLRLDALLCAVMALTFPWIVYIGERVKRLQHGLTATSLELEDIEESAWRDELTGVYNRRALNVALKEAERRASNTGEPLAMCMIDLDHFKRFNDELGHLAGDEVLKAFAHTAQAGLRTGDVFGRYGGEEFLQLLPRTDLTGAVSEVERLRTSLRQLELPVSRSIGALTISAGVAQYRQGEPAMETLARADAALRRAKLGGRDRIERGTA